MYLAWRRPRGNNPDRCRRKNPETDIHRFDVCETKLKYGLTPPGKTAPKD
jgi:hypothetical protein